MNTITKALKMRLQETEQTIDEFEILTKIKYSDLKKVKEVTDLSMRQKYALATFLDTTPQRVYELIEGKVMNANIIIDGESNA